MAQLVTDLTRIHEDTGLSLGLAQWVKDASVATSYSVGNRRSSIQYGRGCDGDQDL